MADYKNTILNDNPVIYWSFDNDVPNLNNSQIIDEIGNVNPLTVAGDSYRIGQGNMLETEPATRKSVSIAQDQDDGLGNFPNTHFICPVSTDLFFPNNNGSHSIEFTFLKQDRDRILQYYSGTSTSTTPIYFRAGVMALNHHMGGSSGADRLTGHVGAFDFSFEYSTGFSASTDVIPTNLIDNIVHMILVWEVADINGVTYSAKLTAYINGRPFTLIDEVINFAQIPQFTANQDLLLGANGGNDELTDYATEELRYDDFSIYDYALSETQISEHYIRTKFYKTIIRNAQPRLYSQLNDDVSTAFDEVAFEGDTISHLVPRVVGAYTRDTEVDVRLSASRGISFTNGYLEYGKNAAGGNNDYPVVIDYGEEFTFDFWFSSVQQDKGVLLHAVSTNYPSYGVTLIAESGRITLQVDNNTSVTTDILDVDDTFLNFFDGLWHHVIVRGKSNHIELIIDGVIRATMFETVTERNSYTPIILSSDSTGLLKIAGAYTEFALYERYIDDIEIIQRTTYNVRYKIEGYTLLQGVGVPSSVRFYDNLSGNFLGEITSGVDGYYEFFTPTNKEVQVIAFLPSGESVRYRIHAPIKPSDNIA